MSQQVPFDPFTLWKQMYDQAEEQWGQVIDDTMHKEEFSQMMGQCLNGYLRYQDVVRKTAEKCLEQSNMPSKQDLANVAQLVINLENKFDNVEQALEGQNLNNSQVTKLTADVESLKSQLSSIQGQLDQLFVKLDSKLSQVETATTKESTPSNKTKR